MKVVDEQLFIRKKIKNKVRKIVRKKFKEKIKIISQQLIVRGLIRIKLSEKPKVQD